MVLPIWKLRNSRNSSQRTIFGWTRTKRHDRPAVPLNAVRRPGAGIARGGGAAGGRGVTMATARARDAHARELVARARETNARRDQDETAAGFANPFAGPTDETIRTIICALMAGIMTSDWNAVAEGYVMLC